MDAQQLSTLWLEMRGENLSDLALITEATYKLPPGAEQPLMPAIPETAYVRGREIGRGGVGVVCEALQASLQRNVAVKTLLPGRHAKDPHVVASFLAEAQVTGSLEHPNIVPVYDLHSTPDAENSLVLKLVRGKNWKEDLEQRPDALVAQLEILNQICNAVAFAHSHGIVHNDLKPGNVMLGPFGEVLVMDWGLAVSLEPPQDGSLIRHKNTIRAPCGTPAYMPAELAEGRGSDLGPWTDIYLLGGMLYHILTGRPPHRGATVLEVLLQAVGGEIEPLDPSIPDELRQLCMKALALDPGDRWPSVLDFQQALQNYLKRRESLQLANKAWRSLRQLKQQAEEAERSRESLNRLYDGFAQTLHGFENARVLAEHPDVLRGAFQTHLAYAGCALDHGDLGLAEAQLSKLHKLQMESSRASADAHKVTLARLEARVGQFRAKRARDRRLRKSLKRSVLGLAVLVVLLGLGFWESGRRGVRKAVEARRARVDERLAAWTVEHETELTAQVRALINLHAGQADPEARRELSIGERQANGKALKELLHMIADFERVLSWDEEPVHGEAHQILPPEQKESLATRAADYRATAFQLALLNDSFDLAEILINQADLATEQLSAQLEQLQSAREARVNWQLEQTRAALADIRAGRQRSDRPPAAYNLDEYTILLSSFQHPRIARELAEALAPYTAFARQRGDISRWTQAEREEITLVLEVLGYIQLPDQAVPALTAFLQSVADLQLASVCARSLCNTRQPAVNDLMPHKKREGTVAVKAWRSVLDAFARVPTPTLPPEASAAEHLRVGHLFLIKRAHELALRSLDRSIALQPDDPWAHFYRASACFHRGEHQSAIASIDRALALGFPELAMALIARARSQLELDNLEEALADLDRALPHDTQSTTNFLYRGIAYERLGQREHAILCFSKAIALDPNDAECYLQRGLSYRGHGRPVKAQQDFTSALSLDPELAEAYGYRGGSRIALKDWEGAFADLDQAVRRQPQAAKWRALRARTLIERGELARARLDLEVAERLDPTDAFVHTTWATLHLNEGDLGEAQASYETLAGLPGFELTALIGAAELQLASQQPLLALEALEQADVQDPGNTEVLTLRVDVLWLLERYDEALAACTELLQRGSEQGWVYARRGMIRLDAGDPQAARQDLERALEQLPGQPVLHQLRSKTFAHEERWQEALAAIELAHELDPEEGNYRLFRASILIAIDEFVEAEEILTKLIATNPDYGPAYTERGSLHFYQDQFTDALADYDRSLELDPDEPRALLLRGYTCYNLELWQRVDEDLSRAMASSIDARKNLDAHLYRGEARVRLGLVEAAMEDFERAVLLDPEEPWVYDYRAFGQLALKNYPAAREDAQQAIALGLQHADPYVIAARAALGMAGERPGPELETARDQALALLEVALERGLEASQLEGEELELLWQSARGLAFLERVRGSE